MIAGVAGGMAEYANIDAALMRLIWVLAFLAGGVGFLAYIVCWIVIPEGSGDEAQYAAAQTGWQRDPRRNFGFILIGLGLIFLIKNFMPWYYWEKGWPLLLVILGLYILLANRKGDSV